jgi:CheY-like chemotaxis protein
MGKLLLVGKLTTYYRELSSALSKIYEVRACVDKLPIFNEMFKNHEPDLIIAIIDKKGEDDQELLTALENDYRKVPVICICPDADDEWIKSQMRWYRFVYMSAKYTIEELCQMIEHLVNGKPIEEKDVEPLCDEEVEEVLKSLDKYTFSAPDSSPPESSKSEKKDILLVDDSGVALRTLKGLIGDKYDVRMATSGIDAISMIHKKCPDLIFLDCQMPLLDGKQTMEKIRELEEAKDIPIVFVTAVNDKAHIKAVLGLKPAGYLLKPVDKDKLLETIEMVIGE